MAELEFDIEITNVDRVTVERQTENTLLICTYLTDGTLKIMTVGSKAPIAIKENAAP